MAHESFEDESVAGLMNDAFVSIQVDREERPDIDSVYMNVCRMISQSCGWPLNVVLTPDGRPFFATTYVPRDSRFRRQGMTDLVPHIAGLWATQRDEIVAAAAQFASRLSDLAANAPGDEPGETELKAAYSQLSDSYDNTCGGFGRAPKFPTPHILLFLLRQWHRTGDDAALAMVEGSLQAMRRGGVYDHVGFGFHRYATDREWELPHFEKMLYDQALLVMAYVEAFQATGDPAYSATAREVIEYVLRDLTSPDGAFYSAEDADSEGEEGRFYVWTAEELREVLGDADAALATEHYNVRAGGNFSDEATGRRTGANVLFTRGDTESLAADRDLSESELRDRLEVIRETLLEHREKRVRPLLDDKVLTDWNGLMIAALAKAARALDAPEYAAAASRAAAFVLGGMRRSDGRLLHRFRSGEPGIDGTLDDYAFFVWALIELYETTFDAAHLAAAAELTELMLRHFRDDAGGLFLTPDDGEELVVRPKESLDSAVPSGNSVAMLNLLRLSRLTGRTELEAASADIGRGFGGSVGRAPGSHTLMLSAVDFAVGPSREVVITGNPERDDTRAMVRALNEAYVPTKVVVFRPTNMGEPAIDGVAPYVREYGTIDGRATAYVCEGFACHAPTTDAAEMLRLLGVRRATSSDR
jgi:uncharacterized protein YyaL (SSP411 family)